MITSQIIILSILFVLDVGTWMAANTPKLNPWIMVGHFVRLLIVWALLISAVIANNDCQDTVAGKCPEFEPVTETYYKRKL